MVGQKKEKRGRHSRGPHSFISSARGVQGTPWRRLEPESASIWGHRPKLPTEFVQFCGGSRDEMAWTGAELVPLVP